jgi:hypothetical protein
MSKDMTLQLPVIIGTLSMARRVGTGKLRPAHRAIPESGQTMGAHED